MGSVLLGMLLGCAATLVLGYIGIVIAMIHIGFH